MHNLPDFILIRRLNELDEFTKRYQETYGIELGPRWNYTEMEEELESRIPIDNIFYFGDCEGQPVFVPIEDDGIIEAMGYDEFGEPIF